MISPSGMLTANAVNKMDAHLRNRGIHQKQAAQGKQHDASDGEHAVSRELGFGGEEREGAQNQPQRGKARGQKIQRERRKQDEHHADRARESLRRDG